MKSLKGVKILPLVFVAAAAALVVVLYKKFAPGRGLSLKPFALGGVGVGVLMLFFKPAQKFAIPVLAGSAALTGAAFAIEPHSLFGMSGSNSLVRHLHRGDMNRPAAVNTGLNRPALTYASNGMGRPANVPASNRERPGRAAWSNRTR